MSYLTLLPPPSSPPKTHVTALVFASRDSSIPFQRHLVLYNADFFARDRTRKCRSIDASRSRRVAMAASYYSVDAILTDSQKAPCTFELSVPQLAALNNGSTIEPGTKMELPFWLAEMLAVSRPAGPSSGSLASLDLPAALNKRVVHALRADPKSVDVRAQAQWFYGLGGRVLDLFEDDEIVDILLEVGELRVHDDQLLTDRQTFKQRALEISDRAQNTRQAPGGGDNDFMKGLDEAERSCEFD